MIRVAQSMKKKYLIFTVVLVLGLTTYGASSVFAVESSDSAETQKTDEPGRWGKSPKPLGTPRVKGMDRLKDNRLKMCQKGEKEINARLTNTEKLVNEMLAKFDTIAQRVQEFYNNKVVLSGKTVPTYSVLIADIAVKKAAVQTTLTNAKSDISGFSCTAENPKGQITQFKTDMQSVKKALQDYRTSIKNLIVAVKSVAGVGAGSGSPRASGKPVKTELPEPTLAPTL